jgi:pimeloyl-ACP methyl ester carboxylesterase
MTVVELTAGPVAYADSGGPGPTVVLLHGLMTDGGLWDRVVADLAAEHRCIVPTLPLGAHRFGMHADADLSLGGIAELAAEFLERLDLTDVVLVGNDTGGALVQLMLGTTSATSRVRRIVLVSCDAFDNYPPGLTGRTLVALGRLTPSMFGAFMQQMRVRMVRRLPIAFGWLTKRGDAVTARCMAPVLHQREIRRDIVRTLRAARVDADRLRTASAAMSAFTGPALVVWAAEDRVMPPAHGRRLADLMPGGRFVEVHDSYTLIPLDQPDVLTQQIAGFVAATAVG